MFGDVITPEAFEEALVNARESIDSNGFWAKVCVHCDQVVGVKLKEAGEPSPDDLTRCVCSRCWDNGVYPTTGPTAQDFRMQFIPPKNSLMVYSTAVADGVILVKNTVTGKRGCVANPTPEEWKQAFHAPSRPYPWSHPERVIEDSDDGN
jgi:hypothetical protein